MLNKNNKVMRKITFSMLFIMAASFWAHAQIQESQNFNSSTSYTDGWSDDGSFAITPTGACDGNSARDNLWSGSVEGNLYSPQVDNLSSGTGLDVSFNYKVVDYISSGIPINATQPGWGSLDVSYTLDQGITWVNLMTIDDSNHVVSNNCVTISLTIPGEDIPSGSDFQLKFTSHWLSGDFFLYLDDISIVQTITSIPNCDVILNSPVDGEINASTSGLISWDPATGGTVGYTFSMGTSSGAVDIANQVLIEGGDTFYNAGDLNQGTTYYISINPYNNLGEATCSEFQFTTFEIPSNDSCSEAIEINSLPYSNSQNAFGSTNNDGFITACGLGMNDGVWYTFTGNGEEIAVLINETSVWNSELAIYSGTCDNFTCIDFSETINGNQEIVFASNEGETYYINIGDSSHTVNEDEGSFDISITSNSTCSIPSDILVENISQTSVDVSWIENGTASEWQIVYGEEGFNPEINGTSIFDNDGNLGEQITGLTPNTTYDVYVFSVCNASLSDLLGPVSFTTEELSVKSNYFSEFLVYPNPTNSLVNLKSAYPIKNISLYNILGKKIYSADPNNLQTKVNLNQLSSGVYLLQIKINEQVKTVKLLKE